MGDCNKCHSSVNAWFDILVDGTMTVEQSDLLRTGIAGLGNASSSLARWQLRARVMYSAKARRAVIQDVI